AESGNKRARTVLRVLNSMKILISATQLGITLASLALGYLGEETIASMLKPVFAGLLSNTAAAAAAHTIAIAVAYLLLTYFHIVLGELVPKTLALERAETAALLVARPIELFYTILKAPIWILNHS